LQQLLDALVFMLTVNKGIVLWIFVFSFVGFYRWFGNKDHDGYDDHQDHYWVCIISSIIFRGYWNSSYIDNGTGWL